MEWGSSIAETGMTAGGHVSGEEHNQSMVESSLLADDGIMLVSALFTGGDLFAM